MIPFIWLTIFCSFLWTLFYALLCCLNYARNHEWNCRIVATSHALLLTTSINVISFVIGPWPFAHFAETNTLLQNLALSVSAGYFLFDTLWCIFMQSEGVLMLLHHMISLMALIGGLMHEKSACEVTAVIWGSELTNPFLQIRWFLKETQKYETTFARLNDIIFVTLFATVRIGIGSYLCCIIVLYSQSTVWWIKLGGIIFHSISFIWMWQISRFAKKRFIMQNGLLTNEQ